MALWQKVLNKIAPPRPKLETPTLIGEIDPAIIKQLKNWQQRRQLLEVRNPISGHYCQSMVLGVFEEQGYLEIDDLFPQANAGDVRNGDYLQLRLQQGGRVAELECQVQAYYGNSDWPVYRLRLPKQITTGQRRRFPRIALSEDVQVSVAINSPGNQLMFGSAENISAGGMRLRLPGNALKDLYPGASLNSCEFRFPGDLNFKCRARVKGLQFQKSPARHTNISLSFIDLPSEQLQQIKGLIDVFHDKMNFKAA